ncbi:DeoR/GlpR family DNA-binding transcription regulator [Phytohabitans rumicis]|uniref:Lactose phosphotransferase system repressor n=1 Tax=Phytohabitans rumicis TaxID=1076125 RepID=A0A6V8KXH2_9ACTN|nr:DeoR/GlpR family DNA-binding transcription regulator [Phytohabitans rumicis]GFJ87009.1 DeoR family transcriptional regulator [Phytohabitans rumicis]
MYAVERQRWLVEHARTTGRIDVNEVAQQLDVAPETVRRDLNTLERHGLVRRVHGGAIPVERLGFENELVNRATTRQEEKGQIARAALNHLDNAESIYVDEGTTAAMLAELLEPKRPMTVVTSALPVACQLAARPMLTVLSLGGRVRGHTLGAVDQWAVRMLEDLVIDLAVIGTNGITVAHGLTCPDAAVAAVKRRAIASSRRSILLADHSKFGVDSSVRFADVREMDLVITDRATVDAQLRPLRRLGVEVVHA